MKTIQKVYGTLLLASPMLRSLSSFLPKKKYTRGKTIEWSTYRHIHNNVRYIGYSVLLCQLDQSCGRWKITAAAAEGSLVWCVWKNSCKCISVLDDDRRTHTKTHFRFDIGVNMVQNTCVQKETELPFFTPRLSVQVDTRAAACCAPDRNTWSTPWTIIFIEKGSPFIQSVYTNH